MSLTCLIVDNVCYLVRLSLIDDAILMTELGGVTVAAG